MLYDMILYKMIYYNSLSDFVNASWRQEVEPVMLKYLAHVGLSVLSESLASAVALGVFCGDLGIVGEVVGRPSSAAT